MNLVDRDHDSTDLRDGNRSTNLLAKNSEATGSTAAASITATTGLGARKTEKMNTTAKASNKSGQLQKGYSGKI